VPLDVIRAALREAVQRDGLRAVSRAVPVDSSNLLKLLDGSNPRAPTRQKLTRWYLERAATPGGADGEAARAALAVLTASLRGEHQDEAVHALKEALRGVHARRGLPEPGWLRNEAVRERGG